MGCFFAALRGRATFALAAIVLAGAVAGCVSPRELARVRAQVTKEFERHGEVAVVVASTAVLYFQRHRVWPATVEQLRAGGVWPNPGPDLSLYDSIEFMPVSEQLLRVKLTRGQSSLTLNVRPVESTRSGAAP